MTETLIRFVVGGLTVSVFALAGDLLKPKSFAGLFGAAPAVAIASLSLAIATHGHSYASLECRSMLAGAIALGLYSALVRFLLLQRRIAPLPATLCSMLAWFTS